jgi:formylglycine-generating enzyme required for sulfatase activity
MLQQQNITTFPPTFPFSWACAWGEDNYGLFQEFEYKGIIQRMRWIPPGWFIMGSPIDEEGRRENEILHQVVLTKGFWFADTACTQELWLAVMEENPARFRASLHNPVNRVTWDMLHSKNGFFDRINSLIPDLNLCLPTEAQWEYACKAGSTTPFWWGRDLTVADANYNCDRPYSENGHGEFRKETVPVKSFERNPWGLWQMHGNVYEWCSDFYGEYPDGTVTDPSGPLKGEIHVNRGGSWASSGHALRSAYRGVPRNSTVYDDSGFRFARGCD